MSPAVTSVFPALVTVFGGQQSARTIHFFAACILVLFLVVHRYRITSRELRDFNGHEHGYAALVTVN